MAPIEQIDPSDGKDAHAGISQLDDVENCPADFKPDRTMQAPPMVRDMTAEERKRKERIMVRKIDFRLLPPVIIMYIMNYLDRCVDTSCLCVEDARLTCAQEQHCYGPSLWRGRSPGRPQYDGSAV